MRFDCRFIFLSLFVFSTPIFATEPALPTPSGSISPPVPIFSSPIEEADFSLKEAGMPLEFINGIHKLFISKSKKWQENASKIIELNTFGFLGKSDYEQQDTKLARKKIRRYLKVHLSSFKVIRKKHLISPEAIASLLWVETRHGKNMGNFSLVWVFYSMVMGAHPQFVNEMLALTPEYMSKGNPKNYTLVEAKEKVKERCKSKAQWALQELKAILTIQNRNYFNPLRAKASFAGAFGIPQFIPSTYLKSAISPFRNKPNLFKHSDAIASVANFLVTNGWKEKEQSAQASALFSYNRSKDYGLLILKLAQEVRN